MANEESLATRLTRRFPAGSLAVRNLSRQRLRAGLAMLGIVIGVFAVVTLGMLGTALQTAALAELGGLGNQVIISPSDGEENLGPREIQAIRQAAAGGGTVIPLKSGGASVSGPNGQSFAQLYGTTQPAALFGVDDVPDTLRQGVAVGDELAAGVGARVGSAIEIEGNRYRVLAIIDSEGTFSPIRPGSAVVLPPDEFVADDYAQVVVQADSADDARAIADGVRERLNSRQERVSVLSLTSVLSRITEFFALLNGFLLAVAGISLVVAGVSIFNVMLMTVSERRGEIGVLRAVGIHRDEVLRTLLVESTLLGVVGGALGAVLGAVVVVGVALGTRLPLSAVLVPTNGLVVLGAFGFGMLIALGGGLYPAYRAAWEPPVESLRG
ncbi:ABC transporter permease [Halosegnis longus]|uniref:ABC transporter permease n=1 Tax=Halosegnis longus TaxID=2216012 RepID=UPI00129DD7A8|nr:ABC transporter permease [Halosegnis longus]